MAGSICLQGLVRRGTSSPQYLSVPLLLRSVCQALDRAAGTDLAARFAYLFRDLPNSIPQRINPAQLRLRWAQLFCQQSTWDAVRSQLLPALEAACEQAAAGSELQDAMFRDVAISAVSCTNPSCTNLRGPQEADLLRSMQLCAKCREARYCCRWVAASVVALK
jgi:hypothetical protein